MMNKLQRKLLWCGFVTYLSAPGIAYSSPWSYENSPLWLGSAVQHNLMFAIDDSGSMDFEVLFANNDGAIYLDDNGFFADSSGALYESGDKYTYLFPNGHSGSYNGKRKNNNHYAIPPVPAYAFARSPSFNSAYYDPAVTYNPWPNFDEYSSDAAKDTFIDADVDDTDFEPISNLNSVGTLALFADHDTASNTDDQWAFDIEDDNMVCDNDGGTCATGQLDYSYYPATYYLKDTTSTYYFHVGSNIANSSDSVLLEAESAAPTGPLYASTVLDTSVAANIGAHSDTSINDALRLAIADAKSGAIGNDFIGSSTYENTNSGSGATIQNNGSEPFPSLAATPRPVEGSASYSVDLSSTGTGTYNIWMRVYTLGGSSDSFFVKLDGFDSTDVGADLVLGPDSDNSWPANGGGEWNQFWNDLTTSDGQWEWKLWAQADIAVTNQLLEVRRREGGTFLDQILFTKNLTFIPSGSASSLPSPGARVDIDCSVGANPSVYQTFVRYPEQFLTTSTWSTNEADRIDGLAYDGSCLKKYEIARTGSDTDEAPNGVSGELKDVDGRAERTIAEEKQNFANWFQYYRRRHQAMRGGLASAMQGVNGIQTGLFWINNRRTVEAGDMFDMDTDAGVKAFLSDHLEYVSGGGTPLRSALKHALTQYQSADGPIGSECQKNYTLLFTDGFNSETSLDGIGNEDDGAGVPYQDGYDDTLGDIAYKGYSEQLRTDLTAGNVKVAGSCGDGTAEAWEDCNTNLHMNTYTVGLGAKGTIFGVTHNTIEDAYDNNPTWPNVNNSRDARQIDDLYHAAVNGRGGMYNAATPDQLKTALGAALDDIIATIGSGSGVTFNSSSLQSTDGTAIFTTIFNSADWSGDVGGLLLNPETGAVGDPIWSDSNGDPAAAAAILNERDLTTDPRVILTLGVERNGSDVVVSGKERVGAPFQWAALSDSQRADLKTNPDATTVADAGGEKRLEYLRGDKSITSIIDGSNTYELRDMINNDTGKPKRMADIVHSAPVYVGAPASIWPDDGDFGGAAIDGSQRYSAFRTAQKDRTPIIYVGANGGMLHGFDASITADTGGQEVLAYVPRALYSSAGGEGLHYLTDPNYSHKYYVDLSPVAQDVYTTVDGSTGLDWRTMLVGGLRGGGRGIFALDVTDPSAFSENPSASSPKVKPADTVMWEFSNADDGDMGYLLTPPSIAMMNNGEWAVIFGNGHESDSGVAKLFILFVEEGLDGTWSAGDYIKLDTEVGSAANKNGLSGVTLADTNGDYVADRIYAGDLYGNMWAFDVSSSNSNGWDSAYKSGSTPKQLFTAKDSSDNPQPITGAPNIALNTSQVTGGNEPNILVTFGTGQYLSAGDETDDSVQSFYTVWDAGSDELTRSALNLRELEDTADGRGIKTSAVDMDWTTKHGWYFDLIVGGSAEGERIVNRPLIASDQNLGPVAIFASMIPSDSECAGGGSSVLYAVPMLTGVNSNVLDIDGVGIKKDTLLNDPNRLGEKIYGSKSESEGLDSSNVSVDDTNLELGSERTGRLGWNELLNQ